MAESRFQTAAAKHQESAQRLLDEDAYQSSSEEEDLDDEQIFEKLWKSFRATGM